jgi:hypothetical protein
MTEPLAIRLCEKGQISKNNDREAKIMPRGQII